MRFHLALLALLLASPALAQPADLVLRGGKVITVDKDFRVADGVAIKDGRFLAVGSEEQIVGHIGPSTQVIELAGRTVVPGLIDSHLHQLFAALNGPAVQLLGAKSVADVRDAIGERVARTEAGKWVMASSGWHESILAEGRMPTRHELDAVSPNNPDEAITHLPASVRATRSPIASRTSATDFAPSSCTAGPFSAANS